MKLFGRNEKEPCCGNCTSEAMNQAEVLKKEKGIKVLGSGCAKCNALEQAVLSAISQLQLEYDIEHITDFAQIASYGVMSTPALVIDGKVVSYGKVLSVDEAKKILKDNL